MKFQIGKNGVTEGVIKSLELCFKKNRVVRVSVLKNYIRDKEKIKDMAEEIVNKLGKTYKYRIIGFTIILRKQKYFKPKL